MKNCKLSQYLKGSLDELCYMVQKGKPMANKAIQDRYSDEAVNYIRFTHRLRIYRRRLSKGWIELWIFKKYYYLEIIEELPKNPETAYDHWLLGKAFGYSDEEIDQFITQNKKLIQ